MHLDVIGGKSLVLRKQQKPPRAPLFGSNLGAMHQVAFAANSDELALLVYDRNALIWRSGNSLATSLTVVLGFTVTTGIP